MERPTHGADEVSVEVHAFGSGVHERQSIPPGGPFPYVGGLEAEGLVTAIGEEVVDAAVGDRVMVSTIMNPNGGTWADHVVVPQGGVTLIPHSLDFTTAAAIRVAGNAAVETLFIAGASGGVDAALAIQPGTFR